MKKNCFILFMIVIGVVCFNTSCKKDDNPTNGPAYPNATQDLWEYFNRFEMEAAERGISIDLNEAGIVGVIGDIPQANIAGQCNYNSHSPNQVTIDSDFWSSSSDMLKEFIIFHELGHCQLFRDHLESAHIDGTCTSIMRSGTGDCNDNYSFQTREQYLDELFDTQ